MASMRASHAFLPPHPSSTSTSASTTNRGGRGLGVGRDTPTPAAAALSGGASRRAKCRAGLSLLVGVLRVLQTHYMRGIHGRILTHYAGKDTDTTKIIVSDASTTIPLLLPHYY